jgi:UDP-hydrolysing UDP-N-acetyl-D-glucosamine 2-epimerase
VPGKVFQTGCPSIDLAYEIADDFKLQFDPYKKYGGVGATPDISGGYLVVMQHPVTTEYEAARAHIELTMKAIYELKIPTFWFWPNVDAGSDGTSNGIRAFREQHNIEHIHFFKNMTPLDFLKTLKNSLCLIGNSSVGIRECSFLGIPVVNIGSRQDGRERGANVLDVDYDQNAIKTAIKQQIKHGHHVSDSIYGDGDAGKKIAQLLSTETLTFHKILNY